MMESLILFWHMTGLAHLTWGMAVMIVVGVLFLRWAIHQAFERLFLVSMGFAAILANLPMHGMMEPGGLFHYLYEIGVAHGLFPLLMLFGLGIWVDFGPLIAMPALLFVGAAAQLGVFLVFSVVMCVGALLGSHMDVLDAAAMGMVGGANAPVVLFLAAQVAPERIGAVAVALYAGIAWMRWVQPPLMRALVTEQERAIEMPPLRAASKGEKQAFPLLLLLLCAILLPAAAPLIGAFALGNFLKETGVVAHFTRISPIRAEQVDLMAIVTLLCGLAVGGQLSAEKFLSLETVGIVLSGVVALVAGAGSGLLMGKWLSRQSGGQVNPLIGAAGVAFAPLSARLVGKVGLESGPRAPLLLHAVGANMAGVIGATLMAGVFLAILR